MDERRNVSRETFVDSAKGLTIMLVLLAHIIERYLYVEAYYEAFGILSIVYGIIYSFHMPFFFMLSGYIYRLIYVKESKVLLSRIRNHLLDYMAIYVLMSILVYVSKLLFASYVKDPVSSWSILLFLYEPIGYLWYLHTLILLYCLNIFVIKFFRFKKAILLIAIILCSLSTYIHGLIPGYLFRIFRYEFFFVLGICLKDSEKSIWLKKPTIYVNFVVSLVLELYALTTGKRPDTIPMVQMLIAYGFCVALFMAFKHFAWLDNKYLLTVGRNCLEIYLFHQFPVAIFKIILTRQAYIGAFLSIVLNFIFSFMVVVLWIKILKAMRVLDFLRKPFSSIFEPVN